MRFLRYLCFYCISRFTYSAVRNAVRNHKPKPAAPACKHCGGVILTLLGLPFIAIAVLILIGFLQRP